MNKLANKGRHGDTQLAHVMMGETLVPPGVVSPETMEQLRAEMAAYGIDPDSHVVGNGMSINPETGLPEFGWGKAFKKAFKTIARIALPVAGYAVGGPVLGGAVAGATNGGGLKGALLGGLTSAAGIGLTNSGLLGTAAGSPLSDGLQGPTQGSGLIGSITRNIPSAGSLVGGGSSSFGGGSSLSNILSGALGSQANEDAEDDLLEAQRRAQGLYAPFMNQQFTPGDLTQDPGYQFNLAQGEQALGRAQAARGGYYSGQALKEAQQFGQGLADSTYNDAFQRWRQTQGDNLGVAQQMAGIYGNQGNIRANAGVNNSNLLSSVLSGVLGGSGAIGNEGQQLGRRVIGYNPQTGEPIYG